MQATVVFFSVALLTGFIAVLPQLIFWVDLGRMAPFEAAYDESFYFTVLTDESFSWNQRPLHVLLDAIWTFSENDQAYYFFLTDLFFGVLLGAAAVFVLNGLFSSVPLVVAGTVLILFSSEYLSFNNWNALIPLPPLHLFFSGMPLQFRSYISDSYLTYIAISRTPEPQTTFPFFLFFVGFLIRSVGNRKLDLRGSIGAVGSGAICALGYPFFAAATIGFAMIWLIAAFFEKNRSGMLRFSMLVAVIGIVFLCSLVFTHQHESSEFLFRSRKPLFAVSQVWAVLVFLFIVISGGRHFYRNSWLLLSALLCLVPFVTMNQQLLTGVMVQALNWERYVNLISVVCAFLFVLKFLREPRGGCEVRKFHSPVVIAISLLVFVGQAAVMQFKAYETWISYNLRIVSIEKAIRTVLERNPSLPVYVVLGDSSIDQVIRPRLLDLDVRMDGYSTAIGTIKKSKFVRENTLPEIGYEFAARSGLSPDEFRGRLQREVDQSICWPYLLYFERMLDCAPYTSDFRLYDPKALKGRIEEYVTRYKQYLINDRLQEKGAALYVSEVHTANTDNFLPGTVILDKTFTYKSRITGGDYTYPVRIVHQTAG